MRKILKKGDIKEFIDTIDEEEIEELINLDGSLIDGGDNFKATDTDVKSPGTSKDHARKTAQGPGAYYPFGGAYYAGHAKIHEDEEIDEELEEGIEEDAWDKPEGELPDEYTNIKEDIDKIAEARMQSLVDEMFTKKKEYGIVKRQNETDLMHDIKIPEFSDLKTVYEKPIVARKVMHLTDLINKHDISGTEMSMIFNYVMDNLDLDKLSDEQKEFLGDKLKYGEQKGE